METVAQILAQNLEGGATFEEALAEVRSRGASPVETIKAIREVRRVPLAEAKRLFTESPAWRLENENGRALQEAVIAALESESSKEA